jgi:threonine dehydrogenase-like Zn-dependent dehydrogenase
MTVIQYRKSIPRYLALRALGPRWRSLYTSGASPVRLRDLPPPPLPTDEWVRVRPLLSGVCGSDLATICCKSSPYLAPLTSMPFVLGHEVVGVVSSLGPRVSGVRIGETAPAPPRVAIGDRVVLQPALGCRVRGIEPPCDACARGELALCRNVTRGSISAGIQTGYCRDTGGAWSDEFVAHPSQLHAVPAGMPDDVAVLVEPFACALHGALRALPSDDATALVIGGGTIGLLTIAAMRALGSKARIIAVAKYTHQVAHAQRLGANVVLRADSNVSRRFRSLADALLAELHRPEIGKPTVVGGADVVFDCVASSDSIDESVRFTRAGGTTVLVGMPSIPKGVDWTSIWYKELNVRAAYAYGAEHHAGRRVTTFDLALELLSKMGEALRPLVGEPFALTEWRSAVRAALRTGESRSVKTVFRVASA